MSFLRDLPSVHRSLVHKLRPERISVLSESLPSLSSLYDGNCDARDVMLMIVMTIINMMTMIITIITTILNQSINRRWLLVVS